MKQKDVFKKIGGIIQELSDQYEYLQTVNGELNDLELELFVANAHFLTDHIEILCKLNLQNNSLKRTVEKQEATSYEQKYFEPVVQQMKHATGILDDTPTSAPLKPVEKETAKESEPEELPVAQTEPVLQPAEPVLQMEEIQEIGVELVPEAAEEPETIRHELVLDETKEWEEEEPLPDEQEEEKGAKKRKATPAPPVEALNGSTQPEAQETPEEKPEVAKPAKKADDEVLTINQKISVQLGDKVMARTEQLSIKPISDIKLAITLNDKLLYVKDLFNGYNLAYSEAIEILNRFNTFEEAARFLKTNYVVKNNWESKPTTSEKFYALLKRRYA